MVPLRFCLATLCIVLLACSSRSSSKKDEDEARPTRLVGIDPLVYKCENLVGVDEVTTALGAPVTVAEVAFEPPPGTAAPCNYLLSLDAGQQPWSFDMDCRRTALDTARSLFTQYESTADKTDAGISDVDVGKQAMDHHGQALLFIDDDTPCHVRMHGPTAEGRLSLARLIAKKLVLDNAPMMPRPAE